MQVLIAPDKFAGTLSAAQAAAAIAEGWRRTAPADDVELLPLADGGPGFIDVLGAALDGRTDARVVAGPYGEPASGRLLIVGETAYVEAADACGLHLSGRREPGSATTYGVGELIAAAVEARARRIVVGLGGSVTNDGGAGMLAALGAEPAATLRAGGAVLADLDEVDVEPARARLAGVDLVIASDVDNPLWGPRGASVTFAPQKGASPEEVGLLDIALRRLAERVDWRLANKPGAGAAGGLGYGMMVLGGARTPGAQVVLDAVGAADRAAVADLVITGEGSFDWQSLQGKVVAGVARVAQESARPCIVLAGQVKVGRRELSALGVDAAYSVVDVVGSLEAALAEPAGGLAALAERVARTWSLP